MRNAHTCVEYAQIVVNLSGSGDGRTRIHPTTALFNGYRWTQPLNGIYVRLVELMEKLAGIGTQAFHITPLALRIEGMEGKR